MKYYFKENFRLLYADGTLYDENQLPVYTYENQTVFLPQIDLYKYGERIGHVKKNFTLILRNYDIVLNNEVVDSLQQQFTLAQEANAYRKSASLTCEDRILSSDSHSLDMSESLPIRRAISSCISSWAIITALFMSTSLKGSMNTVPPLDDALCT